MPFLPRCARLAAALLIVLTASAAAQSGPPGSLTVPPGFTIERIATVPEARELAATPNGDLIVGTEGETVYLVADAEGTARVAPFVRVGDRPVAGVALDGDRLYLGSQFGVWELPYHAGDRAPREQPHKIASVRPGGAGGHSTTSVAVAGGLLYASVGSSCNACQPERDDTRATIQQLTLDGAGMRARATHIRNAIALATDPQTGALWAGVAGQDELPHGHPYEIFDPVTLHPGVPDYGWPVCYEDHRPARAGIDCAGQTVPRVVFPAYATPIGAAFYPPHPSGPYAFPAAYRGGAFVTLHGSWHVPPVAPRVVFVPLDGDTPAAVDWDDPAAQWSEFVGGFQHADGTRVARPTGVAVGRDGSLFVSDDLTGGIYRIRPAR